MVTVKIFHIHKQIREFFGDKYYLLKPWPPEYLNDIFEETGILPVTNLHHRKYVLYNIYFSKSSLCFGRLECVLFQSSFIAANS